MTLGQRIQELRKQAGLSQETLGEALGVSRQAVSKWEGDNGIPELDTLIAMSRLFRITVGQLLGVETQEDAAEKEKDTAPAGFTEEQVEEILRRYAEESRRRDSDPPNAAARHLIGSWIIAVCAVIAAVIIAVPAFGRVRSMVSTISNLQSQISVLHSDLGSIRNQVSGLSSELRDVIEEQSSILSTFDYEVVSFDLERETVDLKLSATLKTYTAGYKAQFVLNWKKVDHTEGETICDPVEGPKFETVATIPMNFHLEVGARIHSEDGTIYEQPVDMIYSGMHPDEFKVQLRSGGVSAHGSNGTLKSISWDGQFCSQWPKLIYPILIETQILINGEEFLRESGTMETTGEGTYYYRWNGTSFPEPVPQDDLELWYIITDNTGRQHPAKLN